MGREQSDLPIQPAPDVHFFPLDDESLVLSVSRQEIHALNLAATFMWTELVGGRSLAYVEGALAEGLGLSAEVARRHVEETVVSWREAGLTGGPEPAASIARPDPARDDVLPGIPPLAPRSSAISRLFRVLDSNIRAQFDDPEALEVVWPVVQDLASTGGAVDLTVDVVTDDGGKGGGGFTLYRDHLPVQQCEGLSDLAPAFKDLLWQIGINRMDYWLYIHAGVVGWGDGCVLLPGSSGSGKSTLTAALVANGFDYLSDEAALVRDGDFLVRAAPQSLCIKPGSIPVLEEFFPGLGALAAHQRRDNKMVRYLPPPASDHRGRTEAVPARALVFPVYDAGAPTELRAVSSVEALRRVLGDCLAIPGSYTADNVARLVGWISALPCYELTMRSAGEAVTLIRDLLSGLEHDAGV